MPNAPGNPENYPGSGKFVILCEGDLIGYEAAILGQWLRARVPSPEAVDVRQCGTSAALLGMADAVGRTVRVIVVEDRDFRSVQRATDESAEKCAEREGRNVAMRGWVTWSRNEIENYFLDDEVLFPAMREAFACSDAEAMDARARALDALRVFQAVQAAVSAADGAWGSLVRLRHLGGGRPKWTSAGLEPPQAASVRAHLESQVRAARGKVCRMKDFQEPFLGRTLLDTFDARLGTWSTAPLAESVWKVEWAGKEILRLVRQQLAARFRAPSSSQQGRIAPVDWAQIGQATQTESNPKTSQRQEQARDAMDRDIERAIQPVLVKHLWAYLDAVPTADMNHDLSEIAKCFIM